MHTKIMTLRKLLHVIISAYTELGVLSSAVELSNQSDPPHRIRI
jgi:hypothetical protein